MKKRFIIIIAIICVIPVSYAFFKKDSNKIRVAIVKDSPSVALRGNLIIAPLNRGNGRAVRALLSHASIRSDDRGFDVSGKIIATDILEVLSDGKPVSLNGRRYDGDLHIFKNDKNLLLVVNVIPMEDYLTGLVASEISSSWPIEAIKAQAVASRSYATYQKEARSSKQSNALYDIEAGVMDQVYHGKKGDEKRLRAAVDATKGEILKKRGQTVKAFFHSSCGGETEKASNVWGESNVFSAVKDPYCLRSPDSNWSFVITIAEFINKLRENGFPAETIEKIEIESKKGNPRIATTQIDTGNQTIYIQTNDLRKILGFQRLKSAWFNVKLEGNSLVFSGKGFGHGVGMCQWGAKGMAEAGKNYREILEFYYPGTKIEKEY